jgi:hypothetical protein
MDACASQQKQQGKDPTGSNKDQVNNCNIAKLSKIALLLPWWLFLVFATCCSESSLIQAFSDLDGFMYSRPSSGKAVGVS